MKANKLRFTSIELIRFLAAVAVAMFHFGSFYLDGDKFFPLSYIFVEFFFIVSGFFMMKYLTEKENPLSSVSFVFKKICGFFPVYTVTFFAQFIIFSLTNKLSTVGEALQQLFHFKWEFLLLHGAGFVQNPTFGVDYLQGQTWYLSAMVIALVLAYPLAKYCRKIFIYLICPISCIIIYSYIIQTIGNLNIGNEYFGFILAAIPRGFAGTCMGCMSYQAYYKLKDMKLNKFVSLAIEILIYGSVVSLFVVGRNLEGEDSVFFVFIFSALVVFGALNQTFISKFLNEKLTRPLMVLGKYSLYLYLCHWNVLMLLRLVAPDMDTIPAFVIYSVVCFVYSVGLYFLDKLKKRIPVIVVMDGVLLATSFLVPFLF